MADVDVSVGDDHVAVVEIRRPPNNHFRSRVIGAIADAYETLDRDSDCRVILLCSEGKHFCAGAEFTEGKEIGEFHEGVHVYENARRLFATELPVVAAVQGAAIGGGLGLALTADFRVAAPEARFSANFARIGVSHGFGLTDTLPARVGQQHALEMLLTGRRLKGQEAFHWGLCDRLVPLESLRAEARAFAADIALSSPLAIRSIRRMMRGENPAERFWNTVSAEWHEQSLLVQTSDFLEGLAAYKERRPPMFQSK